MPVIRFFLIPLVKELGGQTGTEPTGQIVPKYIPLFPKGKAFGQIASEIAPTGKLRNYREDFYVVKFIANAEADFDGLRAQSDVIDLSSDEVKNNKTALEVLGIDVSGLDAGSSAADFEKRVYSWLVGKSGQDHTATFDKRG